jgi:hypothetical protein
MANLGTKEDKNRTGGGRGLGGEGRGRRKEGE